MMNPFKRRPPEASPASQGNPPISNAKQMSTPRTPTNAPASGIEQAVPLGRAGDGKPMISEGAGGEQQRPPSNTTRPPSADLRHAKHHTGAMIDGIDVNLYKDLVKEIGQPARHKKKVNTGLAEKMHTAGWSYAQIAKHFQVSACTIRRRLNDSKR